MDEKINRILDKYAEENKITNSAYAKMYSNKLGKAYHSRLGLNGLKRGRHITACHLAVFCEFLTDSQKSEFFAELSKIDFFGGEKCL